MLDRPTLKARGMAAFKRNYWPCVVVAFIIVLVSGRSAGGSFGNSFKNITNRNRTNTYTTTPSTSDDFDISKDGDNYTFSYDGKDYNFTTDGDDVVMTTEEKEEETTENDHGDHPSSSVSSSERAGLFALLGAFSALIIGILLIAIAVGVAVSIFVKNPILVGCKKYFTINSFDIPKMGEVVFAFKKGIYLNVVKVEFFKNLFIFLWSLLFVIPGIIKGYEYYMVDYILSEDPTIDYKDALEQSKNMMMGYKWSTFVLELSFLGWGLLSALTCGILGFFYVNPYIYATNAELFLYLREKRFPNAAPYYTPSFAGGYAGAAPGANQFNQGVPSQQAAQNQGQYNPGFGGQDFNSGFGGQDYNPGFSAPAQPYDPRNNAPQNGTQEPSQNKYSMNQNTPQDDQPSEPPVDPDGYYNP